MLGEVLVERRRLDEFGVGSDADHPTVIQDHDLVGVDHGRQPVGYNNEGAILGDRVDRLTQQLLVESVE
jgi:hypothetical protein